MRITIAAKLFIGFLIVILLNVMFVQIVTKLADLNIIANILRRDNDIENKLVRIANYHNDRKRSRTSFEVISKTESIDNFTRSSQSIENLLDSITTELSQIRKLDSAANRRTTSSSSHIIDSIIFVISGKFSWKNTQYQGIFDSLVAQHSFGTTKSPTTTILSMALDQADADIMNELKTAQSLFNNEKVFRIHNIESRLSDTRLITITLLCGTSLFALVFAFIFSRIITNQLRRLKESASMIGKGHFDFDPNGYPGDEIGDLANAFNDMQLDLKTTQEELIRSKRMAAIGEIVASVNHEINNPLMIISGNAQFLELSMKDMPADMKERIQAILEETERISKVTKKLREIKNPFVEDYTAAGEQMINLDKSSS